MGIGDDNRPSRKVRWVEQPKPVEIVEVKPIETKPSDPYSDKQWVQQAMTQGQLYCQQQLANSAGQLGGSCGMLGLLGGAMGMGLYGDW